MTDLVQDQSRLDKRVFVAIILALCAQTAGVDEYRFRKA